ncbi:ribosomal-protein-alanine N-acetyltransferase [bacterium (candidate division B38) B3_B38]|nr:MAG: ribosomal-protein-alanine N-acetyltransferase [bacterium (candidate division B38) B3_B38]
MIRRFSLADLKRVVEIDKKSFKVPHDEWVFRYYYFLSPKNFFVYEVEGLVVGFILFEREGHLLYLAVDPLYRKRGIGRRLVDEAKKHLKEGAYPWAEVRRSNLAAQSFYQSLGFIREKVIPNYYGNEDAYVMVASQKTSGSC